MSGALTTALTFEYAWRTDRGRVRSGNEDAVAVDPELGFLIVADGIGGAQAGEVASALATDLIATRFREQMAYRLHPDAAKGFVETAIQDANVAIWTLSKAEPDLSGMGTTVVVGAVGEDWLAFGYVGDSRLYRLRNGRLEQLSRDHSFIQEVVDQGFFSTREDARRYGIGANILTRALGSSPKVKVSCGVSDLALGDIFLFCTDGLTGMVPEDWLCQVLTASFGNDLEPAAEALVRLANERGGNDNITLALLRVGAPSLDGA
ncbi:PP2C family protein-serine/threonine phosphatase [Thiocapsa bogorovii]|uniref:PP2C family protein-serine/threonine phosphatase n=1 Tax=Thiocapsa bogorovii TaxID=521689 RepID=UPI001E568B7F|nr:PP2C family serine/threonine-protein phosphatase [Thiocapsa bogorovii]UHD16780.1 protein phosphatase 2C domain-containing protein [Thiocapsa bogorovii]